MCVYASFSFDVEGGMWDLIVIGVRRFRILGGGRV